MAHVYGSFVRKADVHVACYAHVVANVRNEPILTSAAQRANVH